MVLYLVSHLTGNDNTHKPADKKTFAKSTWHNNSAMTVCELDKSQQLFQMLPVMEWNQNQKQLESLPGLLQFG